jgi:alpha-mannosidase
VLAGAFPCAEVPLAAQAFNQPLVVAVHACPDAAVPRGPASSHSIAGFTCLPSATCCPVVDHVKFAEDDCAGDAAGTVDVVLRVVESLGGRGVAVIARPFHVVAATQCNLLEEPTHALAVAPRSPGDSTAAGSPAGSTVHVPLPLFQVVSVHLCLTV